MPTEVKGERSAREIRRIWASRSDFGSRNLTQSFRRFSENFATRMCNSLVTDLGEDTKGTLPEKMFVAGYSDSLQCMVCYEVPCRPLRCKGSCGKIWCRGCAEKWIVARRQRSCPTCRDRVEGGLAGLLEGWGPMREGLMGVALLRCPYSPSGCQETGSLDWVMSHAGPEVEEGCEYRVVACKFSPCKMRVLFKDLAAHKEKCAHRVVTCGRCAGEMPAHQLKAHEGDCRPEEAFIWRDELLKRRGEMEGSGQEHPSSEVGCPACDKMVLPADCEGN